MSGWFTTVSRLHLSTSNKHSPTFCSPPLLPTPNMLTAKVPAFGRLEKHSSCLKWHSSLPCSLPVEPRRSSVLCQVEEWPSQPAFTRHLRATGFEHCGNPTTLTTSSMMMLGTHTAPKDPKGMAAAAFKAENHCTVSGSVFARNLILEDPIARTTSYFSSSSVTSVVSQSA